MLSRCFPILLFPISFYLFLVAYFDDMSSSAQILPVSVGYGVVVGVGFFFAFVSPLPYHAYDSSTNVYDKVMMGISHLQNKYTRFDTKTSEEFNTASRSIKPGLIASGIVSAWTWAATLLQSSTVAYQYGVAGPFW